MLVTLRTLNEDTKLDPLAVLLMMLRGMDAFLTSVSAVYWTKPRSYMVLAVRTSLVRIAETATLLLGEELNGMQPMFGLGSSLV